MRTSVAGMTEKGEDGKTRKGHDQEDHTSLRKWNHGNTFFQHISVVRCFMG